MSLLRISPGASVGSRRARTSPFAAPLVSTRTERDSTEQQCQVRFRPVAAKDFFDSLESRADASKLAGMNNSYLFDIEGEGQWVVTVADGKLEVTDGGGEADATITTSGETFDKIVAGEQNPTTAYMTGKLKIKGDMGAAMKLQKLF
jgi:predicted lipid carrier protein YhbT